MFLKDQLHADLLRQKPLRLVKAQCRGVAAPYVECEVIAAALARERHRRLVKRFADVRAAQGLVNAKIVNVKRFDIGQRTAAVMLLIHAEAVALHLVALVDRHQNGALCVIKHLSQLVVGIFSANAKDIGAAAVMHQAHLRQKIPDFWYILFFCPSDHFSSSFRKDLNHIVILFHIPCQGKFASILSLPIYYIGRGRIAFGRHRRPNPSVLPKLVICFFKNPYGLCDFRAIINTIAPCCCIDIFFVKEESAMKKEKQSDANTHRKFGIRDKLAYAAGDLGCNMSFSLKSTVQTFWLVYMMLETGLLSVLLLFVQIWDAVNDPLIGTLIDNDKRSYRLGKFKTYVLVGACGLLLRRTKLIAIRGQS